VFRIFLLSLLFASISLASKVNLNTPSSAVQSYYDAINEGDMSSLAQVMVQDSYDKDVQVYALSIAFKDKEFHKTLRRYSSSEVAKKTVILAVEEKLKQRKKRSITIKKELSLGKDRVMVQFSEDSKQKQLYLSKHPQGWKIDYLAGRKTD
jgi:hypothetical protein